MVTLPPEAQKTQFFGRTNMPCIFFQRVTAISRSPFAYNMQNDEIANLNALLGIKKPEPEPKKEERCICKRPVGRFYYLAFYFGAACPKNNTPECKWWNQELGISVKCCDAYTEVFE